MDTNTDSDMTTAEAMDAPADAAVARMSRLPTNVTVSGAMDDKQKMKEKIAFVLTVYPRLSASMLHTGIGPNTSPRLWRPVLDEMVSEGTIERIDVGIVTHIDQYRSFTFLKLNDRYFAEMRARHHLGQFREELPPHQVAALEARASKASDPEVVSAK